MMPMHMDDAMTFTFLSSQSISRPFYSSVSLIMVKLKTPQKSISEQNIPSDRYESPTLTN